MTSMTARHHEIFEAIRDEVVDQLSGVPAGPGADDVTVRVGRGEPEAAVPPDRAHMGGVLARMQRFVETGDLDRYREFLHRWVVMRLGEGGSPESVLHGVAAIGDTVIRVAHERSGDRHDLATFCREVARASFWATRLTVEVLVDQLDRLEREHRELVEAGGV